MLIYPACEVQIALLMAKKVSFDEKYTDFSDVVSKKFATLLFHSLNINKSMIDLKPTK